MKINYIKANTSFKAIFDAEKQKEFMSKAEEESANSKCLKNKTGAIVVSKDGRIVGKGYNAPPPGITNPCEATGKCPRTMYNIPSGEFHDCTHQNIDAEAGAILKAGYKEASDGTLFLFGHYHLCDSCKRIAIAAQIKDFYIRLMSNDPIKHYSLQEIIEELNNNFQMNRANFLKKIKQANFK